MHLMFELWGQIDGKSYFWKIWVEYKCFWKNFHLIFMHSIHKILCFEEFLHKIALFFRFLIDRVWFSINWKIPDFSSLASAWLNWYSIDARPIETEKFSFFKYLTGLFFLFMFKIHMHCIVFCIHFAILQSYLSLFLHILCIHFAKLGT